MTLTEKSLSLQKMEHLRFLIDKEFKSTIINGKKCYENNSGEFFIPRYVTDNKEIDCLYLEYADNLQDAEKDLFYDGEWIYIPDYPDVNTLYTEAVKQINS